MLFQLVNIDGVSFQIMIIAMRNTEQTEKLSIRITTGSDRTNITATADLYYIKNNTFNTIKFTVAVNSYTAIEGMTWKEFINSNYNTLPFVFMDVGWEYLIVTDGTSMNIEPT